MFVHRYICAIIWRYEHFYFAIPNFNAHLTPHNRSLAFRKNFTQIDNTLQFLRAGGFCSPI